MMMPAAVFYLDGSSALKARALAADFGLPCLEACEIADQPLRVRLQFYRAHLARIPSIAFLLHQDALKLALIDGRDLLLIHADFHGAGMGYRRAKGGRCSEMIAKAVGLRRQKLPTVLDATAGLGVDAFVLASLGCCVTMLERVPAVRALLQDGLRRALAHAAEKDPGLQTIMDRMQLLGSDARDYFQQLPEAERPEVVYLDPMFPERKKSAAVKKEMQLFHHLIGPDKDADQVCHAARAIARDRVVVKRPRTAPALAACTPSYSIEGKRNRYDVYLIRPH